MNPLNLSIEARSAFKNAERVADSRGSAVLEPEDLFEALYTTDCLAQRVLEDCGFTLRLLGREPAPQPVKTPDSERQEALAWAMGEASAEVYDALEGIDVDRDALMDKITLRLLARLGEFTPVKADNRILPLLFGAQRIAGIDQRIGTEHVLISLLEAKVLESEAALTDAGVTAPRVRDYLDRRGAGQ